MITNENNIILQSTGLKTSLEISIKQNLPLKTKITFYRSLYNGDTRKKEVSTSILDR